MGQTVILHTTLARIGPVTRAIAVIVVESLGTIAQKLSTKAKRGFLLISLKKLTHTHHTGQTDCTIFGRASGTVNCSQIDNIHIRC